MIRSFTRTLFQLVSNFLAKRRYLISLQRELNLF